MAKISSFNFGFIVIDDKQYAYDVLLLPDGTVKERDLKKRKLGSHSITRSEIEFLSGLRPDVMLIGTGVMGLARLHQDAEFYAQQPDLNLVMLPSPKAVEQYNELTAAGKKVAALIHITC